MLEKDVCLGSEKMKNTYTKRMLIYYRKRVKFKIDSRTCDRLNLEL